MTIQSDMALMAAGSYWDVRIPNLDNDSDNRAPTPPGWRVLTQYDRSDSGPNAVTGFSARVYENIATGEIVISYAGTEFDTNSIGLAADFLSGNVPLALGKYGSQALAAAKLYQEVKADQDLSDNISFTGHSLGGGLASMMAVWFNRPAHVFAAAPFQASADATQITLLAFSQPALYQVKGLLTQQGIALDPALDSYNPLTDFATREANVIAYAIKGELLENNLGFLNWIEGSQNPLFTNPAITLSDGDKHSIDLHVAALLSYKFQTEAGKIPTALERMMDKKLYGGDVLGNQQVIITKLIRNEVGVLNDSGAQVLAPNGMLSAFANDLQKLGTTVAGLSVAAQNAIIAQGIEWYYWQSNNYGGQEFFTQSGNLLQYTTAQGAGLDGALNKAFQYTSKWIEGLSNTSGLPAVPLYAIRANYDQWNVVANTDGTAATANAKDNNKTQIFIGNWEVDTFTGGNFDDAFFAGDGADTLDGGTGNDSLYGGNGQDTYQFSGSFGLDTVHDADGLGHIVLNGRTLSGAGTLVTTASIGQPYTIWYDDSQAGQRITYHYQTVKHELVITQTSTQTGSSSNNSIYIKNYTDNKLGISAPQATTVPTPTVQTTYNLSTQAGCNAFNMADTLGSNANLNIENAATAYNANTQSLEPIMRSFAGVYTGSGNDVVQGGQANAISSVLYSSAFAGDGRRSLGCNQHRKYYKKHSCLGSKHAGYRQKWHSKLPSTVQNTHSVKVAEI
jgi:RTX calcium-binding nonapeptide repeat (4 copies)/Lipase (class 3)